MNEKDAERGTRKEKTERQVEMQRVKTKKSRMEARDKEESARE